MTTGLKNFIEQHINLIDNNDFLECYKLLEDSLDKLLAAEFTKVMIDLGINPLIYLDYVPTNFARGSKLEDITIPSNIKYVSTLAFYQSRKLKHVVVSEGVREIRSVAFEKCGSGCHVILPSTLVNISEFAFSNIGDMTLEYNGTKKQFKELINKTRYIFDHTFYTCTCLDGVVEKKRR